MEKESKTKILVVGNGFDIACKLPTNYVDFLNFIELVQKIQKRKKEIESQWPRQQGDTLLLYPEDDPKVIREELNKVIKEHFETKDKAYQALEAIVLDQCKQDLMIFNRFYNLIKSNTWIKYYRLVLDYLPKDRKWLDFENEIAKVINQIKIHKEKEFPEAGFINDNTEPFERINIRTFDKAQKEISGFWNRVFEPNATTKLTYQEIREKLTTDLEKLKKALCIYLNNFVNEINVDEGELPRTIKEVLRWMEDETVSSENKIVVTYNYSHTVQRLLCEKLDSSCFCYIHGDISRDNLVLGIDDSIDNDNVYFAEFEKYYQRILKHTDAQLYRLEEDDELCYSEKEVRIIGHSLCVSDKQSIEKILGLDNAKIICYYYKDGIYGLIRNARRIIGKDTLLQKTLGSDPSLEFKEFC